MLIGTLALAIVGTPSLARLPLHFEPNEGRFDANVKFVARGPRLAIGIHDRGARFRVHGASNDSILDLNFDGGVCKSVEPSGALPGVTNYYHGADPSRWRTGIPHFSRVECRSVYTGIDVVYYGHGGRAEYDFVVAPHGDPSQIRMAYGGVPVAVIDGTGDIVLNTSAGTVTQRRPRAWQDTPDGRREVPAGYVRRGPLEIALEVGEYDRSLPLVIDPVIEYLTYLGGLGDEYAEGIAVDALGNAYITGETAAANFPRAGAGSGSTRTGYSDVFVAKLNPTGTALMYSTVLGGSTSSKYLRETGIAIAVDGAGNAYVTGSTYSSDFPTTASAWQKNNTTGFLLKLNATGGLVYSTFLGSNGVRVSPKALAINNGIAYVAGYTGMPEFYGTQGVVQRDYAGGTSDAFITGIDATGSNRLFATLLGGASNEDISAIRCGPDGNLYVTGATGSDNFPTAGPMTSVRRGSSDAFIAKLNPSATVLYFSTIVGGDGQDRGLDIAFDPAGNPIFSGSSTSFTGLTSLHTPVYLDPFGATRTSGGFLLKLTPDSAAVRTLALTNSALERLSTDSTGNVYGVSSSGPKYVSVGAPVLYALLGHVAKISPQLDRLLAALPFGSDTGWSHTYPMGIAVDPGGSVYVAGRTSSRHLAVTPGVLQPERADPPSTGYPPAETYDGFAARFNLAAFRTTNLFVESAAQTINYRMGDPAPAPAKVALAFSGETLPLSVSTDVPGLRASAHQSPLRIELTVDTAAATPGTYKGTVTVMVPAFGGASVAVPVTYTVIPRPTFSLATEQVDLSTYEGLSPPNKTIPITANLYNQGATFKVTSDQTWLFGNVYYASSGGRELHVGTQSRPAGTYTGHLTVSLLGVPGSERVVTVTLKVLPAPQMTLSTTEVLIRATVGQPPPAPASVRVSSSVPDYAFRIFVGTRPIFATVSQTSPRTPGDILISVDHTGLSPGIWSFSIHVNLEGTASRPIFVRVVVSTSAPLDVNPSEVSFKLIRGFTRNLPPPIFLTGIEVLDVTVTSDQPWVYCAPSMLRTPSYCQPSFAAADLPEGVHKANLRFRAAARDITKTVAITLDVSDMPKAVFQPAALHFTYRMGEPAPPAQIIKVTSATMNQAGFQAQWFNTPSRLIITQSAYVTPADISVALNIANISAPGRYTDKVRVSPTYGSTGGGDVTVTIDVAAGTAPPPAIGAIVNGASFLGGEIAPGEIVTVFGTNLGPSVLAPLQIGPDNRFATSLAGTRVLFDGTAAPLIYTSAGQVAALAPYALSGLTRTEVVAEYNGLRSAPVLMAVSEAAPALFAANATGTGQGAIQNYIESDGSLRYNSPAEPTERGSIVILYATGEGRLQPALPDGIVTTANLSRPVLPVTVRIGGIDAVVEYAGTSPGSVVGLLQINARVPQNAPIGNAIPVVLRIGDRESPPGITMAIE